MPTGSTFFSPIVTDADLECDDCTCRCPSGCDCELSSEGCSWCGCGDDRSYCRSCDCECDEDCCESRECGNCGCNNSPSRDLVMSYGENVLNHCQFQGNPKDGIHFGVELEVNTSSERYSDAAVETMERLGSDFVILKHDSSIGVGFEIVSAPATLEVHRERWKPFFESRVKGMSSWNSGRCGMHVHVTRPSEYHTGKILVFMNARAHKDHIVKIAGRNSDQWAAFSNKTLKDGKRNRSYARYEAVNTTPRNTVEFRLFRGTINPERFFRNLEFVHAVVYWTRDASAQHLTWDNFESYVKNHSEEYPLLANYLRGDLRYKVENRSITKVRSTSAVNFPTWVQQMGFEYPSEKEEAAKRARMKQRELRNQRIREERARQEAEAQAEYERFYSRRRRTTSNTGRVTTAVAPSDAYTFNLPNGWYDQGSVAAMERELQARVDETLTRLLVDSLSDYIGTDTDR